MPVAHYQKLVLTRFAESFAKSTEIVSTELRSPQPGELLIKNHFAGVNGVYDDGLRLKRVPTAAESGLPMDMGLESVGEVVELGAGVEGFNVGDAVASVKLGHGYREYHYIDVSQAIAVPEISAEMVAMIPTGVSALVALEQVAELGRGETIAVSAAAGGLGHFVVQIAKRAGNHLIGLVGSDEKLEWIKSLGCDRAINYRNENVGEVLGNEYPEGLNLAFDTVGGEIFDTFLDHLADHGRLVVSGYTSELPFPQPVPEVRIGPRMYWRAASVRAFMNRLFTEYHPAARQKLLRWYQEGALQVRVDMERFEGLASVPDAVEHLLGGNNIGKVVVRL